MTLADIGALDGGPAFIAALVQGLDDQDLDSRSRAADALAKIDAGDRAPAVRAALFKHIDIRRTDTIPELFALATIGPGEYTAAVIVDIDKLLGYRHETDFGEPTTNADERTKALELLRQIAASAPSDAIPDATVQGMVRDPEYLPGLCVSTGSACVPNLLLQPLSPSSQTLILDATERTPKDRSRLLALFLVFSGGTDRAVTLASWLGHPSSQPRMPESAKAATQIL